MYFRLLSETVIITVNAVFLGGRVMEGIIGVAVLFGLAYLLRRASSAFGKTVNQKVLFRSEHEEGLQLLQPAKYEVEATIPEVMKALMMHVDSQTAQPTGLNAVLYHSYNGADKIVYRLGNKLVPKTFETIITCNTTGSKTSVIFQITAWTESSGIIRGLEELSRLKKQVEAGKNNYLSFYTIDNVDEYSIVKK